MEYDKLLEYLYIVLDMEKNIYIQKNTWEQMNQRQKSLGF